MLNLFHPVAQTSAGAVGDCRSSPGGKGMFRDGTHRLSGLQSQLPMAKQVCNSVIMQQQAYTFQSCRCGVLPSKEQTFLKEINFSRCDLKCLLTTPQKATLTHAHEHTHTDTHTLLSKISHQGRGGGCGEIAGRNWEERRERRNTVIVLGKN